MGKIIDKKLMVQIVYALYCQFNPYLKLLRRKSLTYPSVVISNPFMFNSEGNKMFHTLPLIC